MSEFDDGWITRLEPTFLLWKPGDYSYARQPYMNWTEEDKPKLTPKEEYDLITKDVIASDGFKIDFSPFHCVFNYHPAVFEGPDFVEEPETTGDLLKMLAQKSLDDHNEKHGTEFEFVKVVRANYYFAVAIMFLITFQVKDPYDDKIKNFQARVLHAKDMVTELIFCRPEPNQGVECIGKKVVEEDVHKDV